MFSEVSSKHLFYAELAKLVESGFGLREAVRILADLGLPPAQRRLLRLLEQGLEKGMGITESLTADPSLVSGLECSIIGAGERGGRLGQSFQHLAAYFLLLAETRAETLKSLAYPLVLLHLGIILGGVPAAVMNGEPLTSVVTGIVTQLMVAYLAGLLLVLSARFLLRKAPSSHRIDRWLNRLPLIGRARRTLALARFTRVYHTCLLAGLPMRETVSRAATAAQSGQISSAAGLLLDALEQGNKLGPVLVSCRAFPEAFARSYFTAEESGTLDRDLARWADLFQQDALIATRRVSSTIPKVLHALVVAFVVWKILGFYRGYLDSLEHLAE